ncbi:L-ribulose-5-phosphate 4-epimerase AraD [uncultured Eubacterium sp.]|uniref:L-ribulose-5-phosphate 4-epimerase AraD n=1 Tax=uncultured Eubacterium sp. TaxID=165185 RepID=UPI00259AE05A|nr:L-ribulose-5-phosphate 4-epimerase AraD [uncultured Eubacterium sp.]
MLEELKEQVCDMNKRLQKLGLVEFTWGNASALDKESGLVVIKPSGVEYDELSPKKMVVLDLDGNTIDGVLKPSSDTYTHLEVYKAFPQVRAVVHTHSEFATVWAQVGRAIPAYGISQSDFCLGDIPCTKPLSSEEIYGEFEKNAGLSIAREFADRDYLSSPGALLRNHGPFAWGETIDEAIRNAVVIERLAKMAYLTETLDGDSDIAPQAMIDKNFFRKHSYHNK